MQGNHKALEKMRIEMEEREKEFQSIMVKVQAGLAREREAKDRLEEIQRCIDEREQFEKEINQNLDKVQTELAIQAQRNHEQ